MRIGIAVIVAATMASSPAHADGAFFEGDLGLAVPIADDDYEASVDESLKLGLRLGTRTGSGGLDVGIDVTPYSDKLDNDFVDVDIERYRFMIGARYEKPVGAKARLFVRGAGGVDLIHYTAKGSFLGFDIDASETDVGIALEVAGGVLFDVGKVQLGAKLGVPFAFHFEEDDPDDAEDADLDYVGVDFDLAFVVNIPF
jgi:hypothetical protein